MNQDEEHLRLLSIFHYVCAGTAAFFACFPLIYVVMGLVMIFSPESMGTANNRPPAFVGGVFVCMGGILCLLGWAFALSILFAGRCIARRKCHTLCLVMAGISCIFMPFGTILGVFSIIVLIRPSVKALFDTTTPPVFAS